MQLPRMVRTVDLLRAEYRRRHFVDYEPDFEQFVRNLKVALDAHQLPHRVPSVAGSWCLVNVHVDARHCKSLPAEHACRPYSRDWDEDIDVL
jgi:hypothetical protein